MLELTSLIIGTFPPIHDTSSANWGTPAEQGLLSVIVHLSMILIEKLDGKFIPVR